MFGDVNLEPAFNCKSHLQLRSFELNYKVTHNQIKPMKLHETLKKAKSEEDVKDAYIKAIGLKGFTKGLVDIRTKEIWFEVNSTIITTMEFVKL